MVHAIFPSSLELSRREDVVFFAERHPMNIDFSRHAARNDFESDSCMDSGTDTDSDSDSATDTSSSNDSRLDLGDVFDCDDSSDSDGAGDGASANDQCVDIIRAKAARGVGLAHVFSNKLFFTRDIMDDDAVLKHFSIQEPKPKPKPKPALKPKAAPKPGPKGQHRQEFRMVYHRKKGFTSEPLEH